VRQAYRAALVTGASSGIGEHIARLAAADGAGWTRWPPGGRVRARGSVPGSDRPFANRPAPGDSLRLEVCLAV